jgi:hypothetical protein
MELPKKVHKNKKGVAIGQIVEGLLALIILGIIIAVVFGDILLKPLSGISDYIKKIRAPEKEFTPYESSDKVVIDSLNGLRCALNSAAAEALGIKNTTLCPEQDPVLESASLKSETLAIETAARNNLTEPPEAEEELTALDEADIANLITAAVIDEPEAEEEIKCTGAKFGDICVECYETVPLSKNKESAVKQLVSDTLQCWRAFETNNFENIYCGKIKVPPDFEGEITERNFCKALEASGDLGADLTGDGICGGALIFENYEWEIGKLKPGSAPFYICADKTLGNEVFLTRDIRKCALDRIEELKDTTCYVRNFELPQKVEDEGALNPMNWVAGYNDPDYVVYHQALQEGVDSFWHIDEISALTVGLTLGFAVFDAVPALKGAGKAFKSAVTESVQEGAEQSVKKMAQTTVRTAVVGFFKTIKQKGWKRALREIFLRETFENTYVGVSKELAETTAAQTDNFFRRRIPFLSSIRKLRAIVSQSYRQSLEDSLEKQFLETIKKQGITMSGEFFDNYLTGIGITTKEALSSPSIWKETQENALEMYSKSIARRMAVEAVETHIVPLTKSAVRIMMRNMKAENFFKSFFKEGTKEVDEAVLKKSLKKSLGKLGALPWWRRNYLLKQSTELTKKFLDREGLRGLFAKGTGTKFTTAALLGAYFYAEDTAGERWEPVGYNSLAIARPGIIYPPIPVELSEDTMPYFIVPKLHKKSRFYIVSPCKADLVISQDICTCNRMPVGVQHVGFDPDFPPFDVKNVQLDEENLQDIDFIYNDVKTRLPEQFKKWTEFGGAGQYKSEEVFIKDTKELLEDRKPWQKYPETYTNTSQITDVKTAIAARIRQSAADTYDAVNSAYVTAEGGLFVAGEEERGASILANAVNKYRPYFDFGGAQIQCYDRGFIERLIDHNKYGWSELLGYAGDTWEEEQASLAYNNYARPNYKIPCLTVSIVRHPDWNDGINYCIDEFTYVEAERWFWFGAQIIASVVVSVLGDGPGLALALAAGGIMAGYFEEQAARHAKWPAVERQGIDGIVPIVQSEFTEELGRTFGVGEER